MFSIPVGRKCRHNAIGFAYRTVPLCTSAAVLEQWSSQ